MEVNLKKVSKVISYLILLVLVALIVCLVIVPGNWKWIVLVGGILLLLNMIFMYGFLRRNMKKINKK